ncbi:MAG: hypothetical protein GYA59_13595 [Chloroflexi bacterium]|nr:hypothetical protein [Chloroflexota bacterium]
MAHTTFDLKSSTWKPLYRVGGAAALLAALVFRRNIGAEVSLFSGPMPLASAADWFALLQNRPLIGAAFLAVFDLVDYALVGLMLLAVCAAFWQSHKSAAAIALASGLVGIATSFASNITLPMFSLSQQYAAATSEAQRAMLLAAGQALLALNNPTGLYPGTGAYLSLLLLAIAGLIVSVLMLRSRLFSRATAYVGLLASACDLVYGVTFAFAPFLTVYLLASGGLLLMIGHILVGLRLWRLAHAISSEDEK